MKHAYMYITHFYNFRFFKDSLFSNNNQSASSSEAHKQPIITKLIHVYNHIQISLYLNIFEFRRGRKEK